MVMSQQTHPAFAPNPIHFLALIIIFLSLLYFMKKICMLSRLSVIWELGKEFAAYFKNIKSSMHQVSVI